MTAAATRAEQQGSKAMVMAMTSKAATSRVEVEDKRNNKRLRQNPSRLKRVKPPIK